MTTRERHPFLAGLASFFFPGLGQLYVGRLRRALAFVGAAFVLGLIAPLAIFTPLGPALLVLFLVASFTITISATVDAALTARREGATYVLRPVNRAWIYVAFACAVLVGRELWSAGMKARVVQAFRVPSEAMMPTLLPGDSFFADKSGAARSPKSGDVITFKFPEDPRRDFVKRCVAVEGQTIELRDKVLWIDGRAIDESTVVHIDDFALDALVSPRDNFGPYVVPAGSSFVMGDNRDNSNDSRFWGPVDDELVIGTARWIYWSWDAETSSPRWERIGKWIR
jgi:signal peptidase I